MQAAQTYGRRAKPGYVDQDPKSAKPKGQTYAGIVREANRASDKRIAKRAAR